jgi:hypothetical protein
MTSSILDLRPALNEQRDNPCSPAVAVALLAFTLALSLIVIPSFVPQTLHGLPSAQTATAGWVLLVVVTVGILRSNFRIVLGGLAYVAGFAIFMALGSYSFDNMDFAATLYLGLTGVLAAAIALLALEKRFNR